MNVYLIIREGRWDDSDEVFGIYSTLSEARAVARSLAASDNPFMPEDDLYIGVAEVDPEKPGSHEHWQRASIHPDIVWVDEPKRGEAAP